MITCSFESSCRDEGVAVVGAHSVFFFFFFFFGISDTTSVGAKVRNELFQASISKVSKAAMNDAKSSRRFASLP